jgi:NusA family KH domain protein, archaeal
MSEDRITVEELKYMSIFSEVTGATVYRCLVDGESGKLYFLVKKGDLGKAIGRNGRNIKVLSDLFKRQIEVFEYSDDLTEMTKNLFPGVEILKVDVGERGEEKIVNIMVREEDKGKAIGRNGRNVKRARSILGRLFKVSRLSIR